MSRDKLARRLAALEEQAAARAKPRIDFSGLTQDERDLIRVVLTAPEAEHEMVGAVLHAYADQVDLRRALARAREIGLSSGRAPGCCDVAQAIREVTA